MTRFRSWRTDQ